MQHKRHICDDDTGEQKTRPLFKVLLLVVTSILSIFKKKTTKKNVYMVGKQGKVLKNKPVIKKTNTLETKPIVKKADVLKPIYTVSSLFHKIENKKQDGVKQTVKDNKSNSLIKNSIPNIARQVKKPMVYKSNNSVKNNYNVTEKNKKNNQERLNKILNDILSKAQKHVDKIDSVSSYKDLYYYENEIVYLLKKVDFYKDNYESFNLRTENIYNFDVFKLRDNKDGIENLSNYMQDALKYIESKKKSFLKVEVIKEQMPVVKDKKDNSQLLMRKMMLLKLLRQQKRLNRTLKKITTNDAVMKYIGANMKKLVRYNFSFTPVQAPKEMCDLFDAIYLDNELQMMHQMIDKTAIARYEVLLDEDDAVEHTYNSYLDIQHQLSFLEEEMNEPNLYISYIQNYVDNKIAQLDIEDIVKDKVYVKERY